MICRLRRCLVADIVCCAVVHASYFTRGFPWLLWPRVVCCHLHLPQAFVYVCRMEWRRWITPSLSHPASLSDVNRAGTGTGTYVCMYWDLGQCTPAAGCLSLSLCPYGLLYSRTYPTVGHGLSGVQPPPVAADGAMEEWDTGWGKHLQLECEEATAAMVAS